MIFGMIDNLAKKIGNFIGDLLNGDDYEGVPFCFDCNLGNDMCKKCPALKAYNEESVSRGYEEYAKLKFNVNDSIF